MNARIPILLMAGALAGAGLVSASAASQGGKPSAKNIWDGVFSAAQVERGKAAFETHCVTCHRDDLSGTDEGPALIEEQFRRDWGSRSVGRLFRKIKVAMPADNPPSVADADKLAIVSYILHANGFPTGMTDLPIDQAALDAIKIVGKNGPEPPLNGALVAVVGCVTRDADGVFTLTGSSEAVVSSLDDPEPDEAANAAAKAPGRDTYKLRSAYPDPGAHVGHKMLAKGLLVRSSAGDTINVLAYRIVASSCAR